MEETNEAIKFLEVQRTNLEQDLVTLNDRHMSLTDSLEANTQAQAEKMRAISDIDELLGYIQKLK